MRLPASGGMRKRRKAEREKQLGLRKFPVKLLPVARADFDQRIAVQGDLVTGKRLFKQENGRRNGSIPSVEAGDADQCIEHPGDRSKAHGRLRDGAGEVLDVLQAARQGGKVGLDGFNEDREGDGNR